MFHNYRSRFQEESQRAARSAPGQASGREPRQASRQALRRVPSPERMQVPVVVSSNSRGLSTSTSTSSLTRSGSSSGMSTPELVGSEYLEPILAESTYARRATSTEEVRGTNHGTVNKSSKPWGGYAQYLGIQREQSVAKKEVEPGAHRAPVYTPQHLESSDVYKSSLTAAEHEQRGRTSNRRGTKQDNAVMDSIEFEPTIRPHVSKYQSSFASRKRYKSFGGSGNSSERG
ncbi:hypothetical protein OCU04_002757 [Sclerotinia nivalis]|uniref:Uncharacterized protein n=1 Tax=Sclerotinia nivalis TaxID=352851 RepID=A0A9X0AVA2_9HELO|nr:hypothetical protein OCU04_002757 [Sclerotinia nivalis]